MSRYKLMVFDWDGTLSDSLDRIVTCLQISADDVGLPVPSDAAGRDIIGLGLREALARLFPDADEGQLLALRESYSRHYVILDETPSPFYDTVMDTLEHLRSRDVLVAVATGKSRRGMDRVLGELGMVDFFHATRCADETRSKPDPLMLHQLMSHFDVTPSRACMVGDTEYDMDMARRAGMPRIGVSYGAHSSDRLARFDLISCVDRLGDILNEI